MQTMVVVVSGMRASFLGFDAGWLRPGRSLGLDGRYLLVAAGPSGLVVHCPLATRNPSSSHLSEGSMALLTATAKEVAPAQLMPAAGIETRR